MITSDVNNDSSLKIKSLIEGIEKLIQNNSPVCRVIYKPRLLIKMLKEFDQIIEMHDVKKLVILQIKSTIVNAFKNFMNKKENLFDIKSLHCIITGPPGVGKTMIAKQMGRIYYALGIMKEMSSVEVKKESTPNKKLDSTTIFLVNEIKIISNLIDLSREQLENKYKQIQSAQENEAFKHYLAEIWKILDTDNTSIKNLLQDIKLKTQNILENTKIENVPKSPEEENLYDYFEDEDDIEDDFQILSDEQKCYNIFEDDDVTEEEIDKNIIILSRGDFVGEYAGHTAAKTKRILTESLGKFAIIDEAYSLHNGPNDSFGMEALTELIKFIDENENKIILNFLGYNDLMDQTIFSVQPGLKRRCHKKIHIKGYAHQGLCQIFRKQMKEFTFDSSINLVDFFRRNEKYFEAYGGSTHIFAQTCKMLHSEYLYEQMCEKDFDVKKMETNNIINSSIFDSAFKDFIKGKNDHPDREIPNYFI